MNEFKNFQKPSKTSLNDFKCFSINFHRYGKISSGKYLNLILENVSRLLSSKEKIEECKQNQTLFWH